VLAQLEATQLEENYERMTDDQQEWANFHSREVEVSNLKTALEKWEQSDLVKDVPIFWLVPKEDSVTGLKSGHESSRFHSNLVVTPIAIVCSQTCDIAGEAIGERHPFVLLAPLTPASTVEDRSIRKLAFEGELGYLFPVPVPASIKSSKNEQYFADFRALFPASKDFIAKSARIQSGMSEHVKLRFAESLASKFRRPALSDAISFTLVRDLRALVATNKDDINKKVEQVRVKIISKTRLEVQEANLFVIFKEKPSQKDKDIWWTWVRENETEYQSLGVKFGATSFPLLNEITIENYRDSIYLNLELSSGRFW